MHNPNLTPEPNYEADALVPELGYEAGAFDSNLIYLPILPTRGKPASWEWPD